MGSCCGRGGARANVKWEITIPGLAPQRYDTVAEAQQALTAAGSPQGSTIKAVAS